MTDTHIPAGADDVLYDFDAAIAALDSAPLVVRLFGRKWTLPPEPTALAVLRVARMAEAGWAADRELTGPESALLLEDYLGRQTIQAMSDAAGETGFTITTMAWLADWLTTQYRDRNGFAQAAARGGDAADPPPPATPPAPDGSSSGGQPSKPTSPPSTTSTSPTPSASSPGAPSSSESAG